MTLPAAVRDFYTTPAAMTALGERAHVFDDLPTSIGDLCKTIQGLLIHEHWAIAYRVRLTPERRKESQLRSTNQMLAQTFAHNPAPLTEERSLYQRTVGVCRHFAVLLVAMLRHQGIPARARCGFGAYFGPGKFEDHWVAEMWDGSAWRLVDSQIDPSQRAILHLTMNLHDVPRDQFIVAGDAWQQCRQGRADPGKFGIFEERGRWFIAMNLIRDAAALNNMEMLPWDDWGAMIGLEQAIPDETLALLDRVAALTADPDKNFNELRALYRDNRLAVPPVVFNAVLKKQDEVVL